jgi:hypothetical protein
MIMRKVLASSFLLSGAAMVVALLAPVTVAQTPGGPAHPPTGALFLPSSQCMACHNGVSSAGGEDVSFGTLWRASMMAQSARDPYWQAGVRREVTDHPRAQAAIENECSRCHMPMAHVQTHVLGRQQSVFANLPPATGAAADPLAVEGVSCALCHQIRSDALGSKSSFTGGFVIDTTTPFESRQMFGPYEVDPGRTTLMRSATGLQPTAAMHVQQSEVCATCHTLYTHALNAAGEATGEFPEQMPYQEWLHSEFRATQSCQSCHMPVVTQPTPITSVLGEPREGVSRHDFRGANFLMLGVLNGFRADQGVVARPAELDAAIARTKAFMQSSTATVSVERADLVQGRLEADIVVRNLAGHKLPTAYPSRRAWLRVTVRDGQGRLVFSSGEVEPTGAIAGNDNDRDADRFEPHYRVIRSGDEVQVYEAIMGTETGRVTTGLLSAVSYLKDSRLLPRGFDKRTAPGDVAVHGDALADPDFGAGEDRVRYSIAAAGAPGPFTIEVQLWYQSVAYRWAQNLRAYSTAEPQRFVSYYDKMASESALMLTRTARTVVSGFVDSAPK